MMLKNQHHFISFFSEKTYEKSEVFSEFLVPKWSEVRTKSQSYATFSWLFQYSRSWIKQQPPGCGARDTPFIKHGTALRNRFILSADSSWKRRLHSIPMFDEETTRMAERHQDSDGAGLASCRDLTCYFLLAQRRWRPTWRSALIRWTNQSPAADLTAGRLKEQLKAGENKPFSESKHVKIILKNESNR